jgi:3-dehydroquinate synthetase
MAADKKNRAARVRFALARDVGSMFPGEHWTVAAEEQSIASALRGLAAGSSE